MRKSTKKWPVFFENAATFFFWGKLYFAFFLLHSLHRWVLFTLDSNQIIELASIFEASRNGFFQDASAAAYQILFLILPNLFLFGLSRNTRVRIFAVLFSLLSTYTIFVWVADAAIFHYWGTHLNSQAISYVSYPKQLIASVAIEWIIFGFSTLVLLVIWIFRWISQSASDSKEFNLSFDRTHFVKHVITIALLSVVARGGIGKIPLAITEPFKSKSEKINTLSINAFWNINYLLLNAPKYPDVRHLLNKEFYNPRLTDIYKIKGGDSVVGFNQTKSNLVLIVLEGVSAQTSQLLGGTHFNGLTHLDSWAREWGIYSEHCYATGDRTDKGLASIFSGWPGQPWQGILHDPERFKKLPHLMGAFSKEGYQTGFFYGGDMSFANIRAYMSGGGTRILKDKNQLKEGIEMGNWGVHDSDLLNKAYSELLKAQEPYFYSFLTLSSHEPYDIVKSESLTEIQKYFQSVSYVDRSIDAFLRRCFNDKRFDETYFLIISDHGKNLETPETHFGQREFFRIPFYLIGKPLKKSGLKIKTPCFSQADLYNSLLDMFFSKIDSKAHYSRSIFRENHPENAIFHMHEVAGLISKDKIDWITTNPKLIKGEEPLNGTDSVILSLESEIISDFFELN